ncbi:hypothetical protein PoB_001195700 [Plakobranchus ocellatus]|uniref:Uncharacterized protein n=1 Tax=Plakobranchus ocellatus TaxID=259542 RepID=A0AAV3YSL5_9GAST|nr:hypothetical protein PoB_001195700 [Plakobranchus ocellatus]
MGGRSSPLIGGVGSIVARESALRSAGILLSRVRAPLPAPWPDGGPESLRSPCCGLAIYKKLKLITSDRKSCAEAKTIVTVIKPASVFYAIGLADVFCSYSYNYICSIRGNENVYKLAKVALNRDWSDLKPKINAYIHTICLENWDAERANKLHGVLHNKGVAATAAVATSTATTTTSVTTATVELSTGQQMAILYLGIVGGGTFFLTCICTAFWVAVNRRRRRRRSSPEAVDVDKQCNDSSSDEDRDYLEEENEDEKDIEQEEEEGKKGQKEDEEQEEEEEKEEQKEDEAFDEQEDHECDHHVDRDDVMIFERQGSFSV